MPGCSSSLSNKINATGSTNPLIWTALTLSRPYGTQFGRVEFSRRLFSPFSEYNPTASSYHSPDSAALDWSHWLARLTGKGLLELGKIRHHSIGTEFRGCVRIGFYPQSQVLRANIFAP